MPCKALNKKDLTLLTKRRSQSALEYMMTYGWAILIIVIVAVILYSMGIFNPSSSVTFTSSGFSPFTVSSSLCNNIGYKIAVLAGPIPNNANSLTINKVYLTSATGANTTTASYTLTNPVTLKSGQSATILIPNVACNSANIHYSLSAKIQYSYDVPTIGLQTVNTTGTVAGTSITGKPSTLTSYEPITITNTQNSATPSPFQQMINFTSSDSGFSSIATGNFGQNVEFFYYNGTIIPSWLENYTSTNGLWWLKIAAIPGGSSETVYVGFAPTSANLFNTVNDGEAPQLTSTFAEYDDGKDVFSYYNNSNGEGFTILGSSTSSGNGLVFVLPQSYTSGMVIANAFIPDTTQYPAYYSGDDFVDLDLKTLNSNYLYYRTGPSSCYSIYSYSNALGFNNGGPCIDLNQFNILLTYQMIISENVSKAALNINNQGWSYFPTSITGIAFKPINEIEFAANSADGSGSDTVFIHYVAVAQYGQIMPSINFGSVA